MNRLKCFLVFVLVSTLLVSCAPNNNERQYMSNKESSSASVSNQVAESSKTVKKEFVYGYGFNGLYEYTLSGTQQEVDCLQRKKIRTVDEAIKTLFLGSGGDNPLHSKHLKGSFSTLNIPIPSDLDIGYTSIMVLQAFKKAELKDNTYISIDDKEYQPKDLKSYILYEDDELLVYNFTEFANGMIAKEYIETIECDGINLVEVYEKLVAEKKPIVKPIKQ
ncbi:hypothetical protein RBG61_05895 [Paludicola sp. MB14-C6]|uniref:hypothetical protein n=1 Tax=Paludihabitans sp. MB14-C6 TaxID=3070656 RepID=UPI0027DC3CF3|nr:hypothetical protein [Paludicola sp. MB14-C6]WMJ24197.1 hypothetical protein RBG61_05895 [Paludicola sp. MB14-C6]